MTSVNFQQWIQHPETLNRDTLYELRNLLARYPYFQSLRLLYLKNLYILHDISFGGELRKAVLYIADRRQLFRLIEGDRYDCLLYTSRASTKSRFRDSFSPFKAFTLSLMSFNWLSGTIGTVGTAFQPRFLNL